MARSIALVAAMFAVLSVAACAVPLDDDAAPDGAEEETSTVTSELNGTARIAVTVRNNGTVSINPRGLNIVGTISKTPGPIGPGGTDQYTETGIANISSVHIIYDSATGGKSCRFDISSIPNGPNTACTFPNNAQSQGSTFATCTLRVIGVDLMTCGQTVTFTMQ